MNWFDDYTRMHLHRWLRDAGFSVGPAEFLLMLTIFKAGVLQAMADKDDLERRLFMEDHTEVM